MVNHADDKDDFEDEFEFDLDDEFDEDEDKAEETSKARPSPVAERGKSKFPWLIAVAAIGAVGFAGYKFVQMGDSSDRVGDIVRKAPEVQTTRQTQATQPAIPTTEDPAFALDNTDFVTTDSQNSRNGSTSNTLDNQLDTLSQTSTEAQSTDSLFGSSSSESTQASTTDIEKSLSVLKKELTTLSKTSKDVKNNEKDIELTASKVVNIDKNLNQIQQEIKQLTRIVKSLAEQVGDLQSARSQLQAARAAKARHPGNIAASAQKSVSDAMTIHAIIPGRAWLRTQAGKTVSVTEGDMLGEYGKVLKIDAPTGSVITSSGVTIR